MSPGLKGRAIKRAFEMEHTTPAYSSTLRMVELLALQPNMNIRLHIVAPISRREKLFQKLRGPVFSLLDRGALSGSCTYLRSGAAPRQSSGARSEAGVGNPAPASGPPQPPKGACVKAARLHPSEHNRGTARGNTVRPGLRGRRVTGVPSAELTSIMVR